MTAKEIIAARNVLGMTQEELAHAIGVTVSTVNRWESGRVRPHKVLLRQIGTLLDEKRQRDAEGGT